VANEFHVVALVAGFDTVYTDGIALCCVAGLASGTHEKYITEQFQPKQSTSFYHTIAELASVRLFIQYLLCRSLE